MKKIFGMALIFAASLSLSSIAFAGPWQENGPTTVGHRGTTVMADENTMEAFSLAYQHGVHVIECDPHLTKDGVYVIMHDETVDRTTNGTGKVDDLTLEQIMALETESGHQVPTLEQVLVFAAHHGLAVYLDLKGPPPDGGEKLVSLIEKTGMTDRVIMGCYEIRTARMIRKQNPDLSICISWPWPVTMLGAKILGAEAVGTLKGLASPFAIRLAHLYGLKMITMPINDPEKLKEFHAKGLDGLQSDDPALLTPYGGQASAPGE